MIECNIGRIREEISRIAVKFGRSAQDITLVCVSKNRAIKEICEALDCGITNIGENRLQEAKEKFGVLKEYALKRKMPVIFHMIGHLQTNKVKEAVRIFDLIHSVDSLRLAEKIDEESRSINKVQEILIQVNTSGEENKFGVSPREATVLAEKIKGLENIRIKGLMTIAPLVKNPEDARIYFRILKKLLEDINNKLSVIGYRLSALSMGMSQDYKVAIEEGANMLRIGSAIFENRE